MHQNQGHPPKLKRHGEWFGELAPWYFDTPVAKQADDSQWDPLAGRWMFCEISVTSNTTVGPKDVDLAAEALPQAKARLGFEDELAPQGALDPDRVWGCTRAGVKDTSTQPGGIS